jgi:hypothetical protein
MQAIVTKYIGPTNHRGSRIKAIAAAGSVTVPYEYGTDTEGAHRIAAVALCQKLDWEFDHVPGDLPDGSTAWVKNTRLSLSQRVQLIAAGISYDAQDLKRAICWCETDEQRQAVEAHLQGIATRDHGYQLDQVALSIPY